MGSSCEGDALILCPLLGFAVNSFDRPPQLGAVGPVVYALSEFSPLSSFVIQCHFGNLIIHLSAAFDTIDHDNLFCILEKYVRICGNALKLINPLTSADFTCFFINLKYR